MSSQSSILGFVPTEAASDTVFTEHDFYTWGTDVYIYVQGVLLLQFHDPLYFIYCYKKITLAQVSIVVASNVLKIMRH